jgi:thiol:disulfide interchange protein DsbC
MMKLRNLLAGLALAAVAVPALADAEIDALRKTLEAKMPNVKIGAITRTPYGLYEVVGNGFNVFYTDPKGEIGLFGRMLELSSRKNLTEARQQELMKVDFSRLPLDKAIKKVKGDGSRTLVLFSDPDCPYCKQLEKELIGVDNVTIYTFLLPIEDLHPDAPRKSRIVWCAQDRARAWDELMLMGRLPDKPNDACATPLADIDRLAKDLFISGTPGIIFENGRLVPGVLPARQIEALMDAAKRG